MDSNTIRLRVAALQTQHGTASTARLLGIRKEVVLRLAGGADVRAGSLALAEKGLLALSAAPAPTDAGSLAYGERG